MDLSKKPDPYDPREDLKEDSDLWKDLLNRLWKTKKEVYYTFHGLRCGGSRLKIVKRKTEFSFGEDFESDFIITIKKKYLDPHKEFIKIVLDKLANEQKYSVEKLLEECPF